MANDVSSERIWILDTAAEIKGAGNHILVDHLYLVPDNASDAATIQDYSIAGALRTAAYIKAGGTDDSPVSEFWGGPRYFNGFKLSAITAGAVLYVYLTS